MKSGIYIEKDLVHLVLDPETDQEKDLLRSMEGKHFEAKIDMEGASDKSISVHFGEVTKEKK